MYEKKYVSQKTSVLNKQFVIVVIYVSIVELVFSQHN